MAPTKFFIIFTVTFWTAFAGADKLQGTIRTSMGQKMILTEDGKSYPISSSDPGIQAHLRKLEAKDYLSGTAEFLIEDDRMEVTSISYVGLHKLLGLWHTDNWQIFEFADYDTLNLYLPFTPDQKGGLERRRFAYTVAPESGAEWTILLIENDSVATGHLTIGNRQVFIDVVDNNTGRPRMTLQLTPVDWAGSSPQP